MSEKTFEKKLSEFVDKGTQRAKEVEGYYFKYDWYGYLVKCDFAWNWFLLFDRVKQKKYNSKLWKYVETGKDLFDFIQWWNDINYVFEFLKNYEWKYR